MPELRRIALRGTTMIEALVTVLVLGMAALAYANAQLRGAAGNASALWLSKATVLAAEAADRVRANPAGVAAGNYNSLTTPGTASTCSTASICTPAQMATTDFVLWRRSLTAALPRGSGAICLDSTPDDGATGSVACDGTGSQLVVKVFWAERGTGYRFVSVVRP